MPDVSIAISAQDNYSSAIKSMAQVTKSFDKDAEHMEQILHELGANKTTLRMDAKSARDELRRLEKQFSATGDEADGLKVQLAQANYDNINRNLSLVTKTAREAEKQMQKTGETVRRTDNQLSGSGGGILSKLGQAGLTQMLGQSFSEAGNALFGSAFGSEAGTMFSSALSGITSGAAMGSLAGPLGTAIGAAVGGLSGLISGGTQVFEKRDDAFKSYVQDAYGTVEENRTGMTESGSAIAAQREMDQIAFTKLLGGEGIAGDYLEQVRDLANSTPLLYSDLTDMSKSLAPAFGDDPERMLELLQAIGDAGSSVGLDTSNMKEVATSISRMESTGKTTLEYLNIMQERGIDAYGFLADGLDVSKEKMLEMVSKGLIPGAQAAQLIQEGMEGAYAGAMELQSMTFSGLSSTVEGLRQEMDAAKGEGYNTKMIENLNEEIDYLNGPAGTAMKDAYRKIGEWEASIEAEGDKIKRDVMTAVMTGTLPDGYSDEIRQALSDMSREFHRAGTDTGEVMARAEAYAMNLYYDSEGYKELVEYQTALADDIREDAMVNDAWENAGYKMGEVFSKGLGGGIMAAAAPHIVDAVIAYASYAGGSAMSDVLSEGGIKEAMTGTLSGWLSDDASPGTRSGSGFGGRFSGRAYGLDRVPYDGYPAMLHEGERVLTAQQARQADAGGGAPAVQVTVTGNSFYGSDQAMEERVAQRVGAAVQRAILLAAP